VRLILKSNLIVNMRLVGDVIPTPPLIGKPLTQALRGSFSVVD
jgi:hypothetical protein